MKGQKLDTTGLIPQSQFDLKMQEMIQDKPAVDNQCFFFNPNTNLLYLVDHNYIIAQHWVLNNL